MSKQRFHTMTAIKSFVFKHVVDPEFHLTPDEFYEQFDLSAPDELFDLMCVCDDESNALELCYSANYRDRQELLRAGGESLFSPNPAIDISKVVKDRYVDGMIGRAAMIKIKPAHGVALDMLPTIIHAPSFGSGNTIVIERNIDYKNNPFSPVLCGGCNKMFCTCLPFIDPEPEKCKGCDIPFCECWDGKPDPNAEPAPLTYTHEPVEPGSCAFCSTSLVCTCHEAFNKAAKEVQSNGIELPCMGLANGCVCDNCVPF